MNEEAQLNVRVPADLHRLVRIEAAERCLTVRQLVTAWIRQGLRLEPPPVPPRNQQET